MSKSRKPSFELSYESDGKMGVDKTKKSDKEKQMMNEELFFFNTTQNSE